MPAVPVVVAQVQATLDKKTGWTNGKGYGQFNYRIFWRLVQGLAFRTLVVQKVTVTYEIRDENGNDIPDIATFTNNFCMWKNNKPYWEAWIIKANSTQPEYDQYGRPSDDASAKASTVCDDDYSNGPISVLSPNGTTKQVKVKTKGWVQYVGEADLYRIDDPNNSNPNLSLPNDWLKKYGFTEYIPNSSVGPAGVLPYTYTNPNLLAAAKLGKTVNHNMVAYWDCCGREPSKLMTKVEPDKTYTSNELWSKVSPLVQKYGKIKKPRRKIW